MVYHTIENLFFLTFSSVFCIQKRIKKYIFSVLGRINCASSSLYHLKENRIPTKQRARVFSLLRKSLSSRNRIFQTFYLMT